MFQWIKGRQQECEYQKFCFLYAKLFNFGFDGYILKYAPHAYLPQHVDKVDSGEHYRFNIVLTKGWFKTWCEKNIFSFFNDRIVLFRPDLYKHSMLNGDKERIVLSLGFKK